MGPEAASDLQQLGAWARASPRAGFIWASFCLIAWRFKVRTAAQPKYKVGGDGGGSSETSGEGGGGRGLAPRRTLTLRKEPVRALQVVTTAARERRRQRHKRARKRPGETHGGGETARRLGPTASLRSLTRTLTRTRLTRAALPVRLSSAQRRPPWGPAGACGDAGSQSVWASGVGVFGRAGPRRVLEVGGAVPTLHSVLLMTAGYRVQVTGGPSLGPFVEQGQGAAWSQAAWFRPQDGG